MATRTGVVQVSGRGSNVDFTIDDSAPFNQVTKGLRDYLVENRGLWSKGTIGVNAGRWMLSEDQLGLIKHIIETESGLTVGRFWSPPSRLEAASTATETGNSDTGSQDESSSNGTSGRDLVHNAVNALEESPEPSGEVAGEETGEEAGEEAGETDGASFKRKAGQSAGDLLARANEARRAKDYERAARLYGQLGREFKGSDEEVLSRVTYGRVLLDHSRRPKLALRRFDAYLKARPGGRRTRWRRSG